MDYAASSGHADKLGSDDIERYLRQFRSLLGPDEASQETVVFFARLFLDYVFEILDEPGTPKDGFDLRRPRSVPELVENFVDYSSRRVARVVPLDELKVVGLVRRVAVMAISAGQQPAPVKLGRLAEESASLKNELGISPSVDLEDVLLETGLFERPSPIVLAFKVDLIQEYCAVLDVRDRAEAEPPDGVYDTWADWLDRLADKTVGDLKRSGLLEATYACLCSDRVTGSDLTGLVIRAAALLGIEHTSMQPLKIGILHSLQGNMAMSEVPLRDASLLAVNEINHAGGIAGRRVEAIVRDGASDPETFAAEARRLIREDGVISIFGCWTSAARKSVKDVVESEGSLLWYPVQYEGYEESPAVIYGGAAPNQQIIPAVEWCLENMGENINGSAGGGIYLLGSDYVFPRRANALIKRILMDRQVDVAGERYVGLGSMDFDEIVCELGERQPAAVISTINGSSNIGLFRSLEKHGIAAESCPIIALSVAEGEIRDIGASRMVGHYGVWNYFQSLPSVSNRNFVRSFREAYGMGRVTSDPIAMAYILVKLFGDSVRRSQTLAPAEIRRELEELDAETPAGRIRFDTSTGHFSKYVYIGQINADGQYDLVSAWNNGQLVRPVPYPFPNLFDQEPHVNLGASAGQPNNPEHA